MLPSWNPPLWPCRALGLKRTILTGVGPVTPYPLAIFLACEAIWQLLSSRTAIGVLLRQIDKVLLAEAPIRFGAGRLRLGQSFLSRLFTALNLLPSMATLAVVRRPISRQSSTKRAHTLRSATPLSLRKSAMVLSGNSVLCPRSAPSMKRFIRAPRKSCGNHIARITSSAAFSHSQGHFRKSAQVNDKVRSDAVSGRRCPGPASPKSAAGSIGQRNTLISEQRWSVDMKQRRRIYYSAAQRSEIWDRWQAGEPMSSIGRRFDRESSSVFSVISPTGGIRPPDRRRAKQALSLSEREEISRWLSMRCSLRSIARHLGRSASTISREVQRNGGADRYRAAGSDRAGWDRARRPKLCKLACRPFLRRTVSTLLQRQWSPEQIAGWLKRTYPGEPEKQVSHETIYRSLFIQARGVLKKELLEHLRARRTVRRSRHASMKRNGLGQIKNAVSISERPASVEDRAVPGHWEGDLIGGSRNSYVATLVERHSRYVMLVKVANKDTESVVSALIKQSQRLPSELYRSLTWDRGKELADHQRLTLATEVEVYFCDPRSPWQRGSNENTNRLLRQYLPRGTDLSLHSQARLSAIARQLNERPRKTLLYQTPAEKFAECVAAIG